MILSRRALNRATLDRQLLLRRVERSVPDVVEHLVGLQAQTTQTWYTGLWTRLVDFDPHLTGALLAERHLVRMALMRSTIHLVTARDAVALRPVLQPVVQRPLSGAFRRALDGVDVAEVVAAGRALVEQEPRTFSELGKLLAQRWPGRDPGALAIAVRSHVPLVQVPPRGVWGASGRALHTSLSSWLGDPGTPAATAAELFQRYLRAFGPASVRDAQNWSGLSRLAEIADGLRPQLRVFRDEAGRELFDLPDAPRPDPDTPAPVRFIYDFDNLFLGHDDRSRVSTEAFAAVTYDDNVQPSTVLVDGFPAAYWKCVVQRRSATLTVAPLVRLPDTDAAAVVEEGERLLAFLAPKAEQRQVTFTTGGWSAILALSTAARSTRS